MKTSRRIPTHAEQSWSERVNTEHVSPGVIRTFIKSGSSAAGSETQDQAKLAAAAAARADSHIRECDECAWVFAALMSNKGDDVVLDYSYETREALRQMWSASEKRVAEVEKHFEDELAGVRRLQWWTLIGVVLLVALRLWPGLFR